MQTLDKLDTVESLKTAHIVLPKNVQQACVLQEQKRDAMYRSYQSVLRTIKDDGCEVAITALMRFLTEYPDYAGT